MWNRPVLDMASATYIQYIFIHVYWKAFCKDDKQLVFQVLQREREISSKSLKHYEASFTPESLLRSGNINLKNVDRRISGEPNKHRHNVVVFLNAPVIVRQCPPCETSVNLQKLAHMEWCRSKLTGRIANS